jgi:hypothetical protein
MQPANHPDDDQFALFGDDERRERMRAAAEATDRWMRRRLDCECHGAWWFKDCAGQVDR